MPSVLVPHREKKKAPRCGLFQQRRNSIYPKDYVLRLITQGKCVEASKLQNARGSTQTLERKLEGRARHTFWGPTHTQKKSHHDTVVVVAACFRGKKKHKKSTKTACAGLVAVRLSTVRVEVRVRRELLRRVGEGAVSTVRARATVLDVHTHLRLHLRAVDTATLALRAAVTAHLLLHRVLGGKLPVRRAGVVVDVVDFAVGRVGHLPARRQLLHRRHLRVAARVCVVAGSVRIHLHSDQGKRREVKLRTR